MSEKQKTIKEPFSLSGMGLHTGSKTTVNFKPAPENAGISFVRVDLPGKPVIKADVPHVVVDKGLPRCTSIGQGEAVIHTVEHVLSVLSAVGIDNLVMEIDGNELPGLDGSAMEYLRAVKKAGTIEQNSDRQYFYVKEPITVQENGSFICINPSTNFKVEYTLDYNHPHLRSQFFSSNVNGEIFEREIAPCRTFCLESEAKELRERGLGKGANYSNTLVVGPNGVINNKVIFPDEFARHKVLDFIGDLYLFGQPIRGHVVAIKSGHNLNLLLLKRLSQERTKWQQKEIAPQDFAGKKEFTIQDILKVLPHRYPFLMVDRVYEIEKGKKAVGVKNVTINDNFFQGHFPTRPVMPGVLMVEAMAQSAGVMVLTADGHKGQIAFFMSADAVKFRRVVVPGDQLLMEVELIRDRGKTAQIRGVAKVGDEVACEAEMLFSFTEATYLD